MQPILSKKEMTEEDIKLQYITPAVTSKWSRGKITMETPITDGQISLKGNLVFRKKPKKADYILYLCAKHPIAFIEDQDNTHSICHGLQRAMVFGDVVVRVSDSYALAMHIDTDESNAAGCGREVYGEIVK